MERVSGSGNQIINVTAGAATDQISQGYLIWDKFKMVLGIGRIVKKAIERSTGTFVCI